MLIHSQPFWVLCPWPKWGSPTSTRIAALHRRFHWWELGNYDIEDKFLKYTVKAFLPVFEVWEVLMRLAIWPSSVFQEVSCCQLKVFCFFFSRNFYPYFWMYFKGLEIRSYLIYCVSLSAHLIMPAGHVHFDYSWVAENIIPFLNDWVPNKE